MPAWFRNCQIFPALKNIARPRTVILGYDVLSTRPLKESTYLFDNMSASLLAGI